MKRSHETVFCGAKILLGHGGSASHSGVALRFARSRDAIKFTDVKLIVRKALMQFAQ